MGHPHLHCRQADLSDSDKIWHWRNDPHSILMSLSQTGVPKDSHETWFAKKIATPSQCGIYMISDSGQDCGVVRFDVSEDQTTALTSINLNPDVRGQGLAASVLSCAIVRCWQDYDGLSKLEAQVMEKNIASIKVFKRCGFFLLHTQDDVHVFALERS